MRAPILIIASSLLSLTACGDTGPESSPVDASDSSAGDDAADSQSDASTSDAPAEQESDVTLTYWRDAKEVLDRKCGSCHQPDDVAPFPLVTYDDVLAVAAVLPASLMAESMPPWPPADGCQPYTHDRSLDDEERDILLTWLEEGAPEGDPADAPDPSESESESESEPWEPSLTIEMPEPYTPVHEPDDYRCFVIPWPETQTQYVTGYQVVPGNRSVVHHVIMFNAGPDDVAEVMAMDEADPGPGYDCFGGTGVRAAWVGAWVPGSGVNTMPADTGIRIEPGSVMIVQMHYNTLSGGPSEDHTSVEVAVRDEVARPGRTIPFTNPQWVLGGEPMHIPAGDPAATHSFDVSSVLLRQMMGDIDLGPTDPIVIHAAAMHMHYLGKSARLSVLRDGGPEECLLDIPQWDFGWQGAYGFAEPIVVKPSDRLHVSCTWDNSADNQPIVDGEILEPQDVEWGEGTTDEMCLGTFYVTAG